MKKKRGGSRGMNFKEEKKYKKKLAAHVGICNLYVHAKKNVMMKHAQLQE